VAEKKRYTENFKKLRIFFLLTLPVTEKKGTLKILKNQKIIFQIFLFTPVAEKRVH